MILRATSFEIGIASMATLLYADCAPWASATNPSHRPLLSRTVLPNSDQSGASVWIISRSGAKGHSRRILRAYARYYNGIRTHRSLDKDAPAFRSVQRIGDIAAYAILGGLHHHYARV